MSTDQTTAQEQFDQQALEERLDDLEDQVEAVAADQDQQPKMTIIAIHGSLDMAYPTLILSSMAGAFDWDVTVFTTFWALDLVHEEKSKNLKISGVGNPQLPMPNLVGALPGGDRLTTAMMKRQINDMGTESVEELIGRALDNGVKFEACGMAQELMGYEEEDLIDGVEPDVGAGSALIKMSDSDIQLVI